MYDDAIENYIGSETPSALHILALNFYFQFHGRERVFFLDKGKIEQQKTLSNLKREINEQAIAVQDEFQDQRGVNIGFTITDHILDVTNLGIFSSAVLSKTKTISDLEERSWELQEVQRRELIDLGRRP